MVNVSEKTLDKLKSVKEEEEIKSLDGTIRHLIGTPKPQKKIKIICDNCKKEHKIPKYNEYGTPIRWVKCECGHETDINPPMMNEYWWDSNWIPLLEKIKTEFGESVMNQMAKYISDSRDSILEREYLHKKYLTSQSLENDFKWYVKTDRTVNEIIETTGSWPENTIVDINNARKKLHELECFDMPKTHGSPVTVKSLDYMFFKTGTTYNAFFRNNNLTEFIIDRTMENDTVFVTAENGCIQISGIVFDFIRKCAFCPNEIHLHKEAVKLADGRLVCDDCHTKLFDSILP